MTFILIVAGGHAIYQKSVANVRKAHMKWLTDSSTKRGYTYNGIPCVITSEGIYTNKLGELEIGATLTMLNLGCYQFFPERKTKKKGNGQAWWKSTENS